MYQARIAIDDSLDGLKQDMSAEVTIFEPGAYDQALTVPVSAIINRPGEDNPFHCYVLTTEGLQVREVQLGRHNDEMVEVEWGLCEGDQVVLNPKRLEKSFESND
jgi:multidrug efflux pump subunit AcrA (membrane-fusion protein)